MNVPRKDRGAGIGRLGFMAALAVIALTIAAGAVSAETATDSRIRLRIERRLTGQVSLHFERLAITVDNGVATLEGSVASVGEKQSVDRIVAAVTGVESVVNNLTVRLSNEPDAAILHKVQRLLEQRPRFQSNPVQATISGGAVTLTGDVQRGVDRLDAEQIAGSVEGVTQVVNRLQVLGAGTVPPETIRNDVMSVLVNPLTFGVIRHLEVSVEGSVVTLRGEAASDADRIAARRLALTVTGVTDVIDEIVLR